MAPPRKQKLPVPLPENFTLTDSEKKTWKLGKIIGRGGFGLIYLASQDLDKPVAQDSDFVIKLEYHENGPLFSELKFYQRAAKPENIQRWKRTKKLDFLGIPAYWGSGLAEHNGIRYRFMVMDRLGTDLQKVCDQNGGRLKKDTVLQIGCIVLDVLEYIHDNEYVHADIKAANLMLGHRDPDKVYLADYGLSYRYCPDGIHKEYKLNPKKGHNGTMEYTSVDAHNGVAPSRRGDLQVLGFCLLHWLCGGLPWDSVLKNPTQVIEAKASLMDNLPGSIRQLPVDIASAEKMSQFFLQVKELGYEQRPNYQALKVLMSGGGARAGGGQGSLDLSGPREPAGGSRTRAPPKAKKAGRGQKSSVPKPAALEEESEEESEEDDKGGVEGRRNKPGTVDRMRGPPKPNPQLEKKHGRVRAPARRLKSKAVTEEEEEEEEEEKERPTPIAACHLRGPPIGPRTEPKQGRSTTKRPIKRTVTKVAQDFDPAMTQGPPVRHRQCRATGLGPPANRNGWTERREGRSERDGPTHKDHYGQRRSTHRWDASCDEVGSTRNSDRTLDDRRWSNARCLHPDSEGWDYPNLRHCSGDGETHGLSNHDHREGSGRQQNCSFLVKLFFFSLVLVFPFLAVALMKHK